jgi:hypothetical protein
MRAVTKQRRPPGLMRDTPMAWKKSREARRLQRGITRAELARRISDALRYEIDPASITYLFGPEGGPIPEMPRQSRLKDTIDRVLGMIETEDTRLDDITAAWPRLSEENKDLIAQLVAKLSKRD